LRGITAVLSSCLDIEPKAQRLAESAIRILAAVVASAKEGEEQFGREQLEGHIYLSVNLK
jgi:hypothetical protein